MIQVTTIETEKAERLMKALCNHFARKTTARYEGDKGYVEFGDGTCELTATHNTLTIQVEAENADSLDRTKQIVASHLQRFSPDETVLFDWKDPSLTS